jgi:hypothetical protein
MRLYGFLKSPLPNGSRDLIYKIMLHETRRKDVFAYLYTSLEALFCSYDLHYAALEDALEDWEEEIGPEGWSILEDPLPYCQHDCPFPVRVKGRECGTPQWGRYERLENGEWKDFVP